ncbi:non-homologous end-joining DNA ligase [Streptomyces meridianus]|uniref:DNA ligase (ATP) n=1 Tax=Streptomyces meridianus TaxID=2938945 RepID=A0ABT0X358_9ACTN|nr:non-homologous end-joining DNA ligase [Streptomyces meridianus]MCM2576973.1 non-homologous end-joining DNA ligase [Streptomyces meridianus]
MTADGLLDPLPPEQQRLLLEAPDAAESARNPMLAVLSDRRTFDKNWIFERKLDGIRALAVRDGANTHLLSRSGRSLDRSYPELLDALAAQACSGFTVDGEIVAISRGRTDFSRLQQRMQIEDPARARASGVAVTYYVFDLLRLDGVDLTRLPLRTRKSLLRRVLDFHGPLRLTPHRNEGGPELLEQACAKGWEGLIAKRADGRYVRRRSHDWLKLNCSAGQEFVVGGWTEPTGSRTGLGALLLGHYEQGRLRYAGKVGTGFRAATLRELRTALDPLETTASPFADPVRERRVHWARPRLVAEIGFTEWTRDGLLRHPRFLGLRDDKRPQDVVRERPEGSGRS